MIMKSMRKILSSIFIALYFMVYVAPIGFAATIQTGINKPVLRGATTAAKAKPVSVSQTPSPLKLEGDIALTKSNQRISLSLRNSDVKQVLRMFADKAGLNIVFHSSVGGGTTTAASSSSSTGASGSTSTASSSSNGTVTLDLVNMPLNDAFKLVMQVSDLTYYIDHNTMVVMTSQAAQTSNLAKQEMVAIPVKYVDASVMATFLNKNIFSINKPGLSNAQVAITNPSTNEILIFGTDNDVRMARKIISKFDVRPQEATFVVNHTTPKEMATMICTNLFPAVNSSSSGSSSSSSSGNSQSGTPTGGAADSSSSSSSSSGGSSSSSSSSSSGSGSTNLTLGGSVMACQYNNKVDAGSISSFNSRSMAISYAAQNGTISVIGGSVQQMQMVKDFIAKYDRKQPQAYLEMSIIELSESGSREFNNTWNVWSAGFSGTFDGTTYTNPLYPNFLRGDTYQVVDTAANKFAPLYKISKYAGDPMITYTMNYIIKNGKGRVLANPRIMITNGQNSTIDLTSDYVKSVTSQVLTSNGVQGATQRTYTIGNDNGIKVSLTPFISPDGYVTLNIKPEYATIKETITTPGTVANTTDIQATLLQRRNLDLKNVRIRDGETLVIGGMIREDEQKNVDKIPVLGDLPGVGIFFRNTSNTKSKQEMVIMITPKIIKDSEDMVKNPDVTL